MYGNRDSEEDDDSFVKDEDEEEDEDDQTMTEKPFSHGEEEEEDELSKILHQRTVKFCDRPMSRSGGYQVHAPVRTAFNVHIAHSKQRLQ